VDHLGIASLNLAFSGEEGGGVYHSIYDSFDWYTKFGDPNFVYGRVLAQVTGTVVMRLAEAEVLPFEFTNLTETLGTYVDEIEKLKPEGVDVGSLRPVLAGMKKAAERLEAARKNAGKTAPERLRELNLALFRIERAMLDTGGLPGRPWFRHQIYAPGWYTGYDVKTLPGIREAVEHKQWDTARRQMEVVRKVFGLVTEQIGQAARLLE